MKEFMKSALKGIFGVETINDSQIEQVILLNDKAKDNEYKEKEVEKAKDSESAEEKEKEEMKGKDKAKDNSKTCADDEESEEKEKKEKEAEKAKDSESKEKEIKDSIHKELKEIRSIQSLCSKAIGGALSDSAINLDKEVLLNDTLTKLGHKPESKSYEMQKVMLETLVNANVGIKTNKQHISFNDSKTPTNNKSFVYTVDNLKKFGSDK